MRIFPTIPGAGEVEPADYNRLVHEIERLGNITATAPLVVGEGAAGINISMMNTALYGMITGQADGGGNTFQEVNWDITNNVPVLVDDGMASTVYEINGNVLPTGLFVKIHLLGDTYICSYCCTPANTYCIPFSQYVTCDSGTLVVIQKYLNITLPPGATLEVSDTPCSTGSSSSSHSGSV